MNKDSMGRLDNKVAIITGAASGMDWLVHGSLLEKVPALFLLM